MVESLMFGHIDANHDGMIRVLVLEDLLNPFQLLRLLAGPCRVGLVN